MFNWMSKKKKKFKKLQEGMSKGGINYEPTSPRSSPPDADSPKNLENQVTKLGNVIVLK